MAAEAQEKVQRAVESMLNNLEKEKLRPLLKKSHLGSAECCDNSLYTKEQLEECIRHNFQPANNINEHITRELNQFQARIGRCGQQCQDQVQDSLPSSPSPGQVASLQNELDGCVAKCCDDHINLIPKIMMRIHEALSQHGVS